MPKIEVTLPDRIDSEIDRMVERGEFLNRGQAIEELLALGASAYATDEETDEETEEELFTQAVDDQQDPALDQDRGDDEYSL